MPRHRRTNDDGSAVPCICPIGKNHSAVHVDTAAPTSRVAVSTYKPPRQAPPPPDPNVYRAPPRPYVRTRPCPACRVTCEVAITEANAKEILLEILGPGETDDDGLIVIIDTPAGPRAKQYGKGKVPSGAIRRKPHIAVCVRGSKPVQDRWVRPRPRRR